MSGFRVFLEGWHHRHALAFILLLAFATRILWTLAVDVDPRRDFHFDMTFYEIAALRLTEGALLRDFDGTPTAKWRSGTCPLFLTTAPSATTPHRSTTA